MTKTSTRFAASAALFLSLGCSKELAGPDGPLADPEIVPQITFAEHGTVGRPVDYGQLDRCEESCVTQWSSVYGQCSTTVPNSTADDCRRLAHEQVAVCIEVVCQPRVRAEAAPRCAVLCDEEARDEVRACTGTKGFDLLCLKAGDDVYQVCYAAECSQASPFRGGYSYAQGARNTIDLPSTPGAPEADTEASCAAKCEAADMKAYLGCVSAFGSDIERCRDQSGDVYHECMVAHCPGAE